ncbi:MAG: phosphopantetheine-binding protein [Mycobacterium sp.]
MSSENDLRGDSSEDGATSELLAMLSKRLKTTVRPEQDLFAEGMINSMFALELVVQIENTFNVAVEGRDLDMANFRSVNAMANLVRRLADE